MNDDPPKVETNKNIITIVVFTLAVNATIGVTTIGYCLVMGKTPDGVIFTAFVGMINYILGAISGMLVKTSPTETTKQVTVADQPVIVPEKNKI